MGCPCPRRGGHLESVLFSCGKMKIGDLVRDILPQVMGGRNNSYGIVIVLKSWDSAKVQWPNSSSWRETKHLEIIQGAKGWK